MTIVVERDDTKKCMVCAETIDAAASLCTHCKSPQEKSKNDYKDCSSCHARIPMKARHCNHCDSRQGFLSFSQISQTTISLITAFAAIVALFITSAQTYFNRHSSTTVVFVGADLDHLYVDALNGGNRSSIIRECNLQFPNDVVTGSLRVVWDEKLEVSRVVPPQGRARLKVLVEGLQWKREPIPGARLDAMTVRFIAQVQESSSNKPVQRDDSLKAFQIRSVFLGHLPGYKQ